MEKTSCTKTSLRAGKPLGNSQAIKSLEEEPELPEDILFDVSRESVVDREENTPPDAPQGL